MRRTAAAATFSLLVALIVPLAANASAPTRAEFIRKGDALCRQATRELVPLRRQANAAKSLPESQQWTAVTRVWTLQVKIQARFTSRFHALGIPARDAAARRLVIAIDDGLAQARRIRNAFAARDRVILGDLLRDYLRFTLALNHRVSAYGFKSCGR